MNGMLEGIRVLEMGHVVAIPATGALFADWGAEVIKIEPPSGEMSRALKRVSGIEANIEYPTGTVHWMFEQLNRGKKAIVLNLREDASKEILRRLVKTADVFMTNYELGVLNKLGVDYDTLREVNPRLIYALLTGYGTAGPDKDERGFDFSAAWARSGLQDRIGEPGTPPPPQRSGQMDNTTAVHVAAGVLGALLCRERAGIGQALEFSLYHSAVWTINMDIQAALVGRPLPKDDRLNAHNPLWNTYRTKDDRWIRLSMLQPDSHWAGFCRAIGHPEIESDPRFVDIDARRDNNRAMIAIIDEAMAQRTMPEWEALFREHNCIYGRVQKPVEVITDPQALANDFFAEVDHPIAGKFRVVNSPVKMSETPAKVAGPAPALGQHTEEILLELGYTWEDIGELSTKGAIL